jgi:methyl-accepting chemotaxis protein
MTTADASLNAETKQRPIFISLRWKVLVGFVVMFSVIYFLALFVFTDIAIRAADNQIQADLTQTLEGAAATVDVDKLMDLVASGEVNDAGFSDDPRFTELLDFLDNIHQTEPDAWPYLYIESPTPNEIYFVVDLYARYFPDDAAGFLEPYSSNSGFILIGLDQQTYRAVDNPFINDLHNFADTVEEKYAWLASLVNNLADWLTASGLFPTREFGTYGDQFGRWASGYMPLTNPEGEKVAAIGVDFQADTVNEVRNAMRSQVQSAFLVSFPVLLIILAIVTTLFTRPLRLLTNEAEKIGEGDYDVELKSLMDDRLQDEIDLLAGVFEVMVDKVRAREQSLKRQVAQLKIEIDEQKKKSEVAEITDSDFFKDLQSRASRLRSTRGGEEGEE